jgi:hypothetical protein
MYKYRETTKYTNNDDFRSLSRFRFGDLDNFRPLPVFSSADRSPNSIKKIYYWWTPYGNRDICNRNRRKRKTKDIRNTRAKRQNSRRRWWISSDQHALSLLVYFDGPPSAVSVSLLSAASASLCLRTFSQWVVQQNLLAIASWSSTIITLAQMSIHMQSFRRDSNNDFQWMCGCSW